MYGDCKLHKLATAILILSPNQNDPLQEITASKVVSAATLADASTVAPGTAASSVPVHLINV